METDDATDAPPGAIRWSKNLFRTRASVPKQSLAQRILAALQVDLSPGKAAFGERSSGSAQARQMLFSAGENSIDLRITKTEKGFDLRGQILGEGFQNCAITLGKFETAANELSEFSFSEIPAGVFDLTVRTGETEIVIEDLEIN